MTIELNYEPREGYLCAVITGQFGLADAQAVTARMCQDCIAQRQWKLLVDVRQLQGHISDTNRFRYSEFAAAQVVAAGRQAGAPLQLAYLGHAPIIDPERFGMTVARNRGVIALATESLDEALRWLGVT